jgi:hypothetical protein
LRVTGSWLVVLRRVVFSFPLLAALFALGAGGCFQAAGAQEPSSFTRSGYITAVRPPNGFDVNGEQVETGPDTVFKLMDDKPGIGEGQLRDAVRVGAYVRVLAKIDAGSKTVTAVSVLFRDDWDKKLSGFGVIDKVIVTGAEPVFQADGYRIRIAQGTELSFGDGLKTLADVGTNTWVRYKGKRDADGVLVAVQAKFVTSKTNRLKTVFPSATSTPKQEVVPSQGALIDADGKLVSSHTKVRLSQAGGWCGWHKVPADQALQERVQRVGTSVVPEYQKQLPADDPSKIPFRFYVVNEANIRSDLSCNAGLILIPSQVMKRLGNDDQLAALLADGVAGNLQWQSAALILEYREFVGAELAAAVAVSMVPGAFIGIDVGGAVVSHEMNVKWEEQRGRIALALLADAGYDARQAPEVWRLLAEKNLPKNLDSLKYPNRSWYQLGILNLQYSATRAETSPGASPVSLR